MTERDTYFDAVGAAHYSGDAVSPRTLANWRSLGRGPKFLKIGGKVVYRRSDLDEFLASCVRDPEAAASAARR